MHGIVKVHWYGSCGRFAITFEHQTMCSGKDRVWVTGGNDFVYEAKLWNYDHNRIQALDEKRTWKESDVKRVQAKFSDDNDWNTESDQLSSVRVASAG